MNGNNIAVEDSAWSTRTGKESRTIDVERVLDDQYGKSLERSIWEECGQLQINPAWTTALMTVSGKQRGTTPFGEVNSVCCGHEKQLGLYRW